MRHVTSCLFFLFVTAAPAAAGEIYRCVGASGEPAFSSRPCSGGQTVVLPQRQQRRGGGLRRSEQAWLEARAREQRQHGKSAAAKRRAAQPPTKRADDYRCKRKRAALDAVRAQLRRGYKPAQGERLRRRRATYEDYLAAFCS